MTCSLRKWCNHFRAVVGASPPDRVALHGPGSVASYSGKSALGQHMCPVVYPHVYPLFSLHGVGLGPVARDPFHIQLLSSHRGIYAAADVDVGYLLMGLCVCCFDRCPVVQIYFCAGPTRLEHHFAR